MTQVVQSRTRTKLCHTVLALLACGGARGNSFSGVDHDRTRSVLPLPWVGPQGQIAPHCLLNLAHTITRASHTIVGLPNKVRIRQTPLDQTPLDQTLILIRSRQESKQTKLWTQSAFLPNVSTSTDKVLY